MLMFCVRTVISVFGRKNLFLDYVMDIQEILVFIIFGLAVTFLFRKFLFKKKAKKNCGPDDCGCH
jgi:hypothetical protein